MAVNLGTDQNVLIQVSDNVGVREVRIGVDGGTRDATPLEKAPCKLWQYQLDSGDRTQPMVIYAEDWMGNVTPWKGNPADLKV